ncbi:MULTISPECIES: NnrS family protein [unclassified Pseudoalteromonas]|uniref:NnrS family protein n=1 Tax=unclassified Pseudoalteromonas TaxID=194690 RepID=UPI0025B561B3|nr:MULTISPECIES: NnrS family protein [unclassified Pseudoalteromonas]MDN3378518.1 NnrS family protein [Pseudoalteromonas sp. APC 3893]MDN3387069.1 NnrS family protein [Pseudoalteromonas sp. APC 4017]
MRPINLTEPMPKQIRFYQVGQWPLWGLAFRPYFLGASLLAVLSMAYWLLILTGNASWQLSMPATLWHAHEMLFGFAGAVAVGFLLTAAQTWTGVASISGNKLMLLTFVWLAARGVFFITGTDIENFNLYGVLLLQLLWWLAAITALANMLLKANNKNNYQFLPILSALCALNIIYLWLVIEQNMLLALAVVDTAVLVMTLLVGVVAGRVLPFFTARGLGLAEQVRTPRLDKVLLYSSLFAVALYFISQLFISSVNPGWALAVVAVLHVWRSVLWWNNKTLKVPLLWSLHFSYLALGVGLVLLALSFYNPVILFKDALHMITIGTIGMMILAMMTRVSHGHTGRPLTIPHFMAVAFALVLVAAIVRSLLPFVIGPHIAWQLSAVLWLVAFVLFLLHCIPILTRRRVDGRRG